MRIKSLQWLGSFLGLLVLTMSIIGGESLDIGKISGIGSNQTLISVKNPGSHNNQAFFSLDDIKDLTGYNLTFSADLETKIENQPVLVIGTNSQYPAFNNTTLKSGCFWDEAAVSGAESVVVIDEKLAWDVFKRLDVVGETLELLGRKFKVIGVLCADDSLTGFLSDSGLAHVYIPAGTLCGLDKSSRITTLQIQNREPGLSGGNRMDTINVLRKLGKSQEDYYIADLYVENVLIGQKPRILTFLAGIAIIIILLQEAFRRVKELGIFVQSRCENDYWEDVLKNDSVLLAGRLFIILLLLVLMVLIWEWVSFDVYIPPEYLPKNLFDFSFYVDLFRKEIGEGFLHRGYIAPLLELRLNKINSLSNLLFCGGLLLGLPVVWLSLRLSKWTGDVLHLLITPCLSFAAAMTLTAITVLFSGMPLNVNGGDLAVVFSFIYIYSIRLLTKGRHGEGNEKMVSGPDVGADGV
ncbi:MAG: ABC transporter permease [Syntrophomonas sp.]